MNDSEFEAGLERELADPLYRRDRYDIERRREVTGLICELFDRWQINAASQAELLGLSPKSTSSLRRYRKGCAVPARLDRLERIGHLLAIHKQLCLQYPNDAVLRYRWIGARNLRLAGHRPLDVMLEGGLWGIFRMRNIIEYFASSREGGRGMHEPQKET